MGADEGVYVGDGKLDVRNAAPDDDPPLEVGNRATHVPLSGKPADELEAPLAAEVESATLAMALSEGAVKRTRWARATPAASTTGAMAAHRANR
jgi:hypothetical protein